MKSIIVMAASFALSAVNAFADTTYIGNVGYGGTGCPAGSASVTLSPDQKALSLLFDSYVAEAGRTTGQHISRMSCNIAVAIHVPQGLSFSLVTVDYRGFNSLPAGASSKFNVNYFLQSASGASQGPQYSKTWTGAYEGNYDLQNNLGLTAVTWSPCGQDVNLRVNTAMQATTNSQNDQTLATVDSVDLSAGIVYQLQWRTCH